MNGDHEQLVRDLAGGQPAAWHALYDTFAEAVWRSVARRVGPRAADVADIVQETFLAAARSARQFDPARGPIWGWLSGIARRQAALHFRRKQTRPEAAGAGGSHDFDHTAAAAIAYRGAANPFDLLAVAETAVLVRQALSEISIDYETLLVGKYMDGLSLDELAAAEELTPSALSSKLARARRAFRDAYERLTAPSRRVSDKIQSQPAQP